MKNSKLIACLCLLLFTGFFPLLAQQNEITTVILVRHAEKEADGSKDPVLTEQGRQRAQALARMFSATPVQAVYSSNYQRTMATAKPLAEQEGLAIKTYDPRQQGPFITKMLQDHQGETILFVGHSNTIPFAVNQLLQENRLQEMPETEYDKVFIVTILPGGTASLLTLVLDLP